MKRGYRSTLSGKTFGLVTNYIESSDACSHVYNSGKWDFSNLQINPFNTVDIKGLKIPFDTVYNIRKGYNDTLHMEVEIGDVWYTDVVTIDDGRYDDATLPAAVQTALENKWAQNWSVSIDNTSKLTKFSADCKYKVIRNDQNGMLEYMFGFAEGTNSYTGTVAPFTLTSPYQVNLTGGRTSLMIFMKDFNNCGRLIPTTTIYPEGFGPGSVIGIYPINFAANSFTLPLNSPPPSFDDWQSRPFPMMNTLTNGITLGLFFKMGPFLEPYEPNNYDFTIQLSTAELQHS